MKGKRKDKVTLVFTSTAVSLVQRLWSRTLHWYCHCVPLYTQTLFIFQSSCQTSKLKRDCCTRENNKSWEHESTLLWEVCAICRNFWFLFDRLFVNIKFAYLSSLTPRWSYCDFVYILLYPSVQKRGIPTFFILIFILIKREVKYCA